MSFEALFCHDKTFFINKELDNNFRDSWIYSFSDSFISIYMCVFDTIYSSRG